MGLFYMIGVLVLMSPFILGLFVLGHVGDFGAVRTLLTVGGYVILPPVVAEYLLLSPHAKDTIAGFQKRDPEGKKTVIAFFATTVALYVWLTASGGPIPWNGERLDAAFRTHGPGGPRLKALMLDVGLFGYASFFVPLLWSIAAVILDKLGMLHKILGDPYPAAAPISSWQPWSETKAPQEQEELTPAQKALRPKTTEFDAKRFQKD